jgi:hypothetical protein
MGKKDLYVPMNELILNKETHWTFTTIPSTFPEIAQQGILMWCVDNLEGRWTMLGGNKFGFEDGQDATIFKMQFGYNNA